MGVRSGAYCCARRDSTGPNGRDRVALPAAPAASGHSVRNGIGRSEAPIRYMSAPPRQLPLPAEFVLRSYRLSGKMHDPARTAVGRAAG